MNCGELKTRVTVIRHAEIENELGELEPKEETLKTIWAKVEPRTGSLMTGRPADTQLSKTTHAIIVRNTAVRDVDYDCELLFKDAIGIEHKLKIDYILPPSTKARFTTIYGQEVI